MKILSASKVSYEGIVNETWIETELLEGSRRTKGQSKSIITIEIDTNVTGIRIGDMVEVVLKKKGENWER